MPLPRFQRLEPEKRSQLLAIASKEFAAKGYEAASLNDILSAAALGKSSYYSYFADKEDLYATVIEDAFARVNSHVPRPDLATLDAESFWPALEAYTAAMTAAVARRPDFVTLFRPLQGMWRLPSERFQPIVEAMRAQYRAGIEVGRSLGCVRSDLDIDLLISILQAADAALDEHLLNRWEVDPEALREHGRLAFDTVRRLLEPRPLPVLRPTRRLRVVRSLDQRF
jgi:AcrR family transcriptional regulator